DRRLADRLHVVEPGLPLVRVGEVDRVQLELGRALQHLQGGLGQLVVLVLVGGRGRAGGQEQHPSREQAGERELHREYLSETGTGGADSAPGYYLFSMRYSAFSVRTNRASPSAAGLARDFSPSLF